MPDLLITKAFSEIEKYLTLNEEDYKDTHPLDSEEKEKKQDDGCPDCFCEDCNKEDCLWKELGIINKH